MKRIRVMLVLCFCIFAVLCLAFKKYDKPPSDTPVKIGYLGMAYEAPLFVADRKQYFADSGIKVELVKEDSESIRKELFSGAIDGVTADSTFFKYLDEGLDFKLVAGLHSGCVEVIASESSGIKYFKDLLGKNLGVAALGNSPMTEFSSLVRKRGIDPAKDIKWKVFSEKELEKAIEDRRIDGAVVWEGTKLNDKLKVIYRSSGATDSHNHNSSEHFFEGFIALKGSLIKKEPKKAAILSKEWLKATEWTGKNIFEASDIAVNRKYVSDISVNECYDKLAIQMWVPGVRYAKENIKDYVREQREQKLISDTNDENKFLKKYMADIIPDYGN